MYKLGLFQPPRLVTLTSPSGRDSSVAESRPPLQTHPRSVCSRWLLLSGHPTAAVQGPVTNRMYHRAVITHDLWRFNDTSVPRTQGLPSWVVTPADDGGKSFYLKPVGKAFYRPPTATYMGCVLTKLELNRVTIKLRYTVDIAKADPKLIVDSDDVEDQVKTAILSSPVVQLRLWSRTEVPGTEVSVVMDQIAPSIRQDNIEPGEYVLFTCLD